MARAVYSYATMNERPADDPQARRAVIVLSALMAAGLLLPLGFLWCQR